MCLKCILMYLFRIFHFELMFCTGMWPKWKTRRVSDADKLAIMRTYFMLILSKYYFISIFRYEIYSYIAGYFRWMHFGLAKYCARTAIEIEELYRTYYYLNRNRPDYVAKFGIVCSHRWTIGHPSLLFFPHRQCQCVTMSIKLTKFITLLRTPASLELDVWRGAWCEQCWKLNWKAIDVYWIQGTYM